MKKASKKGIESTESVEQVETAQMHVVKDDTTPTTPSVFEVAMDASLLALSDDLTTKANVEFERLSKSLNEQRVLTAKKQGEVSNEAEKLQDLEIALLKAQKAYLEQQIAVKNSESELSIMMLKSLLDNEKLAAIQARVNGFGSGLAYGFLQGKGYNPSQITGLKKGEALTFTYTEG